MKKIFLILLACSIQLFSQNDVLDSNLPISGIISSNEGVFLIYNDGYIQLEQNDTYEEYYRRIYNDSTIVNPNTEIRGKYNLNLVPYIYTENNNDELKFEDPLKFGLILNLNNANKYELTSFGFHILDSLKNLK